MKELPCRAYFDRAAEAAGRETPGWDGRLYNPACCPPAPRTPTRCLLPGCDSMTTHRGGYCSAAHCQAHKRQGRTP